LETDCIARTFRIYSAAPRVSPLHLTQRINILDTMSDDDDFEVDVPELAEDDPMRAFLPQSFGKKAKEADVAAQIGRTKRPVENAPATTNIVGEGPKTMARMTMTMTIQTTLMSLRTMNTQSPTSWY
jgi:hypothetical protein